MKKIQLAAAVAGGLAAAILGLGTPAQAVAVGDAPAVAHASGTKVGIDHLDFHGSAAVAGGWLRRAGQVEAATEIAEHGSPGYGESLALPGSRGGASVPGSVGAMVPTAGS